MDSQSSCCETSTRAVWKPSITMNKVLEISKGRAAVTLKSMPKAGPGFVVVKQHLAPNCIENRIFDSGFFEFHESSDPSCYSEDNAHAIAGWCSHAGHEGVGEIVEIGPEVNGWAVGDRVVIFQGWPCGECWVCQMSSVRLIACTYEYPPISRHLITQHRVAMDFVSID